METKTIDDIILELRRRIKAIDPNIDVRETVIKDIVIGSPAREMALLYQTSEYVKRVFSLGLAEEVFIQDLDNFATTFTTSRKPGSKATGKLRFYRTVLPTAPITIFAGTIVATKRGGEVSPVYFRLIEDVVFPTANVPYDIDLDAYYVEGTIEAEEIGIRYNVGSGTVTDFITAVRGISFILNPEPLTGGSDIETNIDLATRLQTRLSGSNIGTIEGYKRLVLDNFTVRDLAILTEEDEEMIRKYYKAAIDIYIYQIERMRALPFLVPAKDFPKTEILPEKPFIAIEQISGIAEDGTTYYFKPDDYKIIPDETIFGGSIYETTKILLKPKINFFADTNISISYFIHPLVGKIQTFLDLPSNKLIGSDVFVKQAIPLKFSIFAEIGTLAGYLRDAILTAIKDNIFRKVAAVKMGETIQRSDIIAWCYEIAGVNFVRIETLEPKEDIVLKKTEYPWLEKITLV